MEIQSEGPVIEEVAAGMDGGQQAGPEDDRRERDEPDQGDPRAGDPRAVTYTRPWPFGGLWRLGRPRPVRRHGPHRRIVILSSDQLATAGQLVQAALVLALLFVLPGLAWGPLLAPGSGPPIVTAGRAAGASLLVTALACTFLAALGLLTPLAVVVVLGALTAVPFLLPSRRRAIARTFPASARRSGRRRILVAGVALAGLAVVVGLVVLPSRGAVGDSLLPFSSTVWYYANLARETALHGGFPATLPEWGTARPFQTDYLPVTAHTAAAFALLPGLDVRVLLEAYRLAVLGAALATATLLLRRFVSTWMAVLGACLLLATVRLEGRFLAYRPESWALVLVLFTLWLTDRAMTERSRRLTAVAVVAAGVTYLAHAEVFLLLGPGVVGLAARSAVRVDGPGRAASARSEDGDRGGRGRGAGLRGGPRGRGGRLCCPHR